MDHTLTGLASQSMSSERNILGLLKGLGVQECEAALPNGADCGVVWEGVGFQSDVNNDGGVRKAVEVRDGGKKNRRARHSRHKFAGLERVEGREEGVFIVSNRDNLQP